MVNYKPSIIGTVAHEMKTEWATFFVTKVM